MADKYRFYQNLNVYFIRIKFRYNISAILSVLMLIFTVIAMKSPATSIAACKKTIPWDRRITLIFGVIFLY